MMIGFRDILRFRIKKTKFSLFQDVAKGQEFQVISFFWYPTPFKRLLNIWFTFYFRPFLVHRITGLIYIAILCRFKLKVLLLLPAKQTFLFYFQFTPFVQFYIVQAVWSPFHMFQSSTFVRASTLTCVSVVRCWYHTSI